MYVECNKEKSLDYGMLNPHYTDSRFLHAQTVFLAPGFTTIRQYGSDFVEGAAYVYDDRLLQWHGHEENEAAWEKAKESGFAERSPAKLEAYLQALLKDPGLRLVHLLTGFNWGNGYPYRVYGYIPGKREEEPAE